MWIAPDPWWEEVSGGVTIKMSLWNNESETGAAATSSRVASSGGRRSNNAALSDLTHPRDPLNGYFCPLLTPIWGLLQKQEENGPKNVQK